LSPTSKDAFHRGIIQVNVLKHNNSTLSAQLHKHRLRYFPASEPIIIPTAAEPMNSTFLMALWDIKASVMAGASSLST
jgi:hypothetical protein